MLAMRQKPHRPEEFVRKRDDAKANADRRKGVSRPGDTDRLDPGPS